MLVGSSLIQRVGPGVVCKFGGDFWRAEEADFIVGWRFFPKFACENTR